MFSPLRRYDGLDFRTLFLRSIGIIYCIALFSYMLQYPGLSGERGLMPARTFVTHISMKLGVHKPEDATFATLASAFSSFPVLSLFYHPVVVAMTRVPSHGWFASLWPAWAIVEAIDLDLFHDALTMLGLLCSFCIALGADSSLLFLCLHVIYLSLVTVGQTFYSFQWDILLLEITAVSVLYARLPFESKEEASHRAGLSEMLLEFVFFKLMFLSGVVKIQSQCPTWGSLTALEFHFATQCLPTFIAWYFHQLHPLILRLGVAFTLWAEIAGPLLVVSPIPAHRTVGACVQVILQFGILLTGNYTYFNLLTLALVLPCLQTSPSWTSRWPRLQTFMALAFCGSSFFYLISVTPFPPVPMPPPQSTPVAPIPASDGLEYTVDLSFRLSPAELDALLALVLPYLRVFFHACFAIGALRLLAPVDTRTEVDIEMEAETAMGARLPSADKASSSSLVVLPQPSSSSFSSSSILSVSVSCSRRTGIIVRNVKVAGVICLSYVFFLIAEYPLITVVSPPTGAHGQWSQWPSLVSLHTQRQWYRTGRTFSVASGYVCAYMHGGIV